MRKALRATVIALSLTLAATSFAAPTAYRLKVDGLACPFCAYGIEKKLRHSEGVEAVTVDINAGLVTVRMADGATLSEEEARRIVKDAGFSLRGFEEAPDAVDADAGR